MSSLLEVLVTCDTNNPLWTCSVWDPHTGTNLMTYKGGGTAEQRSLSFIGNDYLAVSEKTKPLLHVWPLNSHQTIQGMRFVLPGKATALAVTVDGAYCVAGIEEKIYLWQLSSGKLLTIINRHYQKITLLKFTPDGRYFVSAAADGMVMVWSLAMVATHPEVELATQTTAGQHDPLYMFSDHSLPVTDLYISKMGIHSRLCTVSSDRTCKIYDLKLGAMLLNLVFDEPLTSITKDVLELNVFVGTAEGKIHQFSLTNPPRNRDLLINIEDNCTSFLSHTKAVNCLSVSFSGEMLMSASNDEQVILWHIKSKQPIRKIRHKGPITNAFFTINYPAIYKQNYTPNIILHNLERTLEKDNDEVTEIEVLINKKIDFWQKFIINKDINDDTTVPNKSDTDNKTTKIDTSREAELKEELDKLKQINANLYAYSIQSALKSAVKDVPKTGKVKKNKKRKHKKFDQ